MRSLWLTLGFTPTPAHPAPTAARPTHPQRTPTLRATDPTTVGCRRRIRCTTVLQHHEMCTTLEPTKTAGAAPKGRRTRRYRSRCRAAPGLRGRRPELAWGPPQPGRIRVLAPAQRASAAPWRSLRCAVRLCEPRVIQAAMATRWTGEVVAVAAMGPTMAQYSNQYAGAGCLSARRLSVSAAVVCSTCITHW